MNQAVKSYNNCYHRAIGCAPNELYGKQLETKILEKYLGKEGVVLIDEKKIVDGRVEIARENLKKYQKSYEKKKKN